MVAAAVLSVLGGPPFGVVLGAVVRCRPRPVGVVEAAGGRPCSP
jgi:hypothetical protein